MLKNFAFSSFNFGSGYRTAFRILCRLVYNFQFTCMCTLFSCDKVHRRLLCDTGSVGILNETGSDGKGLIVRGYTCLCNEISGVLCPPEAL